MEEIKSLMANPGTWLSTFGIGALLGVWWWKMTPDRANLVIVGGVCALAVATFTYAKAEPLLVRFAWTAFIGGGLVVLSYYVLWSSADGLPATPSISPQPAAVRHNSAVKDAFEQKGPGFTLMFWIVPKVQEEQRRKYVFDFGRVDGERFSVYFTAENNIAVALYDSRSEPYVMLLPIGLKGLPVYEWSHVVCQAKLSTRSTTMRVLVNGVEAARKTIPFRVDVDRLNLDNKTFAADLNGTNHGKFTLSMVQVWGVSLPDAHVKYDFAVIDAQRQAEAVEAEEKTANLPNEDEKQKYEELEGRHATLVEERDNLLRREAAKLEAALGETKRAEIAEDYATLFSAMKHDQPEKSDAEITVNLGTEMLLGLRKRDITTAQEFTAWVSELEATLFQIGTSYQKLLPHWAQGQGIDPLNKLPPDYPMQSYNKNFSPEHNKLRNVIDYQIKRLKDSLTYELPNEASAFENAKRDNSRD